MSICRVCTRVVLDGCGHAALDDAKDSVAVASLYCTKSIVEVIPVGSMMDEVTSWTSEIALVLLSGVRKVPYV